jgi:hypothetical protein
MTENSNPESNKTNCVISKMYKILQDYSNQLQRITEYIYMSHLEDKIPEKGISRIILGYLNESGFDRIAEKNNEYLIE